MFVQGIERHSRRLANISLKAKRQRGSYFSNRTETINNGIETEEKRLIADKARNKKKNITSTEDSLSY